MSWVAVAGAAVGVVGSAMTSDSGGGGGSTQTKEPWGDAAPWLRQQIGTGQDLQDFYQRNPFNPMQQTGYNNLFSDNDYFRSTIAPEMMGFANGMMGSNYQRGMRNSQAELMGNRGTPSAGGMSAPAGYQQIGTGDNRMPAGLAQAMGGLQPMQRPENLQQTIGGALGSMPGSGGSGSGAGLLSAIQGYQPSGGLNPGMSMGGALGSMPSELSSAMGGAVQGGRQGPFSVNPAGQSYGLLDFNQLNPFTADNGIRKPVVEVIEVAPPELAPEPTGQHGGYDTDEEWRRHGSVGAGWGA